MAAVWIWHSNELYNHIESESLGPVLDLQIPIIPLATQQASKEDSSKEKQKSDSLNNIHVTLSEISKYM